jgi:hypothetical protein
LSTGEQWWRTALALSFTVLALAVGLAAYLRTSSLASLVRMLAGWTIAVWVVRSIGIASADHDAAFIVVHLVLAAVSVTLAALAVREVGARASAAPRP